jgi:hypothetical protein
MEMNTDLLRIHLPRHPWRLIGLLAIIALSLWTEGAFAQTTAGSMKATADASPQMDLARRVLEATAAEYTSPGQWQVHSSEQPEYNRGYIDFNWTNNPPEGSKSHVATCEIRWDSSGWASFFEAWGTMNYESGVFLGMPSRFKTQIQWSTHPSIASSEYTDLWWYDGVFCFHCEYQIQWMDQFTYDPQLGKDIIIRNEDFVDLSKSTVAAMAESLSEHFTELYSQTALVVTNTVPANLSTNIALDAQQRLVISAEFNFEIDPNSVTGNFVVRDPVSGNVFAGDTSVSGRVLTWTSKTANGLTNGIELEALIKSGNLGVRSKTGFLLEQDYRWTFTTFPEIILVVDPVQILEGTRWVWGKKGVVMIRTLWDESQSAAREFTADLSIKFDSGTAAEVTVQTAATFYNRNHVPATPAGTNFINKGYAFVVPVPALVYNGDYGWHSIRVQLFPRLSANVFRVFQQTTNIQLLAPSTFYQDEFSAGIYYVPIDVGEWQAGDWVNITEEARDGDALLRKLYPVSDQANLLAGINATVLYLPPAPGYYYGSMAWYYIRELEQWRLKQVPKPYAAVGLVPLNSISDPGLSLGGYQSVLVQANRIGNTIAHEIAHTVAFPKQAWYSGVTTEHTPEPYSYLGYDLRQDLYVYRHPATDQNLLEDIPLCCLMDQDIDSYVDEQTWISPWALGRLFNQLTLGGLKCPGNIDAPRRAEPVIRIQCS